MFWLFKKKSFRSLLTNELYHKGQMGCKCVKWDWNGSNGSIRWPRKFILWTGVCSRIVFDLLGVFFSQNLKVLKDRRKAHILFTLKKEYKVNSVFPLKDFKVFHCWLVLFWEMFPSQPFLYITILRVNMYGLEIYLNLWGDTKVHYIETACHAKKFQAFSFIHSFSIQFCVSSSPTKRVALILPRKFELF